MPRSRHNCIVCDKEYWGNSNSRFCSTRCYRKTAPNPYLRLKLRYRETLARLQRWEDAYARFDAGGKTYIALDNMMDAMKEISEETFSMSLAELQADALEAHADWLEEAHRGSASENAARWTRERAAALRTEALVFARKWTEEHAEEIRMAKGAPDVE